MSIVVERCRAVVNDRNRHDVRLTCRSWSSGVGDRNWDDIPYGLVCFACFMWVSQLFTVFHVFSQFVRFHFNFCRFWSSSLWSYLSRFRMRCMQFGIFNRYVSMSRDVVIGLFFIGLTFLRTMSLIMISPIAMSRERCLSDNDASDFGGSSRFSWHGPTNRATLVVLSVWLSTVLIYR